MKINFILIPFVIILGLLFANNDNRNNRRLYIIICSALLLFVAAMRSPEYMTDTYRIDSANYKWLFENTLDMDWKQLTATVYMRYIGGGAEETDVGYVALNKIIGLFTHDFAMFSLLADLLFFVPFGIILYRYNTNIYGIMFAFVYYVSLIQVYMIAGGRQMFAIGLDMMALLAVIDRKRLRAIIFFILGLTIHASSFLFLTPLIMIWYGMSAKSLKTIHIICLVLFPLVFAMPGELISFLGGIAGIKRYENYGKGAIQGGANTFIFLIELLSLFCLIVIKKKNMLMNKSIQIFYVMTPFFTFFAPLVRANGTMIRIALYYSIFLTLLVPYSIECSTSRSNRQSLYLFAIGALSFLSLLGGGMTYYFYWQK